MLGIGLENIKLTAFLGFSFYADFLALFFSQDALDFAINMGTMFPVKIFKIGGNMSFTITPSASGTILLSEGSIEWLSSISVSAGVIINE